MVKKDRLVHSTDDLSQIILPLFYQTHLQQHLTRTQFLVLSILLNLLQSERQVKLDQLAPVFPYPIIALCRRRQLQRFLDLPQLTLRQIWYPLITYWLTTYCQVGQTLSIVISNTQWGYINLTSGKPGLGEENYPFIQVPVTQALK